MRAKSICGNNPHHDNGCDVVACFEPEEEQKIHHHHHHYAAFINDALLLSFCFANENNMLAYCVFFRAHAKTQSLRNPVVVLKLSTATISFFSHFSVKSEAEDFAIIINGDRLS